MIAWFKNWTGDRAKVSVTSRRQGNQKIVACQGDIAANHYGRSFTAVVRRIEVASPLRSNERQVMDRSLEGPAK